MVQITYATDKKFKEEYQKSEEPILQLLKYLDFTEVSVFLKNKQSLEISETDLNKENVKKVVFKSNDIDRIREDHDDMLKAFSNFVSQKTTASSLTTEEILNKINDLIYECKTQSYTLTRHSLYYKITINAMWQYNDKQGELNYLQLEQLCGSDTLDAMALEIDLRKEFWDHAANYLEHLLRKTNLHFSTIEPIIESSKIIPNRLIVEIVQVFKEMGYITNDTALQKFEYIIKKLLNVNDDAYRKNKSDFNNKIKGRFKTLSDLSEHLHDKYRK